VTITGDGLGSGNVHWTYHPYNTSQNYGGDTSLLNFGSQGSNNYVAGIDLTGLDPGLLDLTFKVSTSHGESDPHFWELRVGNC